MLWKKKLKVNLLIGICATVFCLPAAAQETYSLPELINRVFSANYQVQIYRNQERAAYNNNTLGNAGFFPTVDVLVERTVGYNTTRSQLFTGESRDGDNAKNTALNAFVEVNWVIFDGFRMFAEKNRLEYLQEIGALETRYFLEQTISDVAKAYYELIRQQQLLETFRQSQDISAYRMRLEKKRLEVGTANGLLYYQAQVDYNADSARIVDQRAAIENLGIQINRLINRSLEAAVIPADQEIDFVTFPSPDSLVSLAITQNRDLRLARLEELLADTRVELAQADRYPELSLFGNYSFARSTSEIGLMESNRSYGPLFGIRLRLNLYDGGRTNIAIQNAELQSQNQRLNRKDIAQTIEANMLASLTRYEALRKQLSIANESLEAAQKSLRIAEEQLEVGAINGYDFRQTQLSFINVKNNIIDLRFQLKSAEIDIRRLSGQLLSQ